ncbi:baculoviral IAP repeat-containing protein 7-like [Watersipora subatra]|uniref:baculoviral IAP repeat-containing protein 7-like n=1 Tax=Watersipora subatra TaxID=2589382 RepID=UPI00355C6904
MNQGYSFNMNDLISEDELRSLLSPPPSVMNQLLVANTDFWAYVTCTYPDTHNIYLSCDYQERLEALPVQEYIPGIMELTKAERLSLMADEKNRRKTFLANWPHADVPNLTGNDMAAAGFYFLGESDKVHCAFCQGILHTWMEGDRPLLEHNIAFGFCKFIRAMNSSNVPVKPVTDLDLNKIAKLIVTGGSMPEDLSDIGINAAGDNEKLAFQRTYSDETVRKKSFYNQTTNKMIWPHQNKQRYERLCKAGFVYIGSNDAVKCFSCHIVIESWIERDNPYVEHARWYPECPHMLEFKGKRFVNTVQKCTPTLKKMNRRMYEERTKVAQPDSQTDSSEVNSAFEQFEACLNRKLSLDAVIDAFEQNDYSAFKNMETCVEAVNAMVRKLKGLEEAANSDEQGRELAEQPLSKRPSTNPAFCRPCELQKNEQKLASHVTTPCGHMVFCDKCAKEITEKLKNSEIVTCPFHNCGAKVVALLKVFV